MRVKAAMECLVSIGKANALVRTFPFLTFGATVWLFMYFCTSQALAGEVSLVATIGAELHSLRKRNGPLLKERDAARAEVERVKLELKEKHHPNLEAACSVAGAEGVKVYKTSDDYRNMRNDLYNVGLIEAVKTLGPRNPNLDATD